MTAQATTETKIYEVGDSDGCSLEEDLRRALKTGEFELYYQSHHRL